MGSLSPTMVALSLVLLLASAVSARHFPRHDSPDVDAIVDLKKLQQPHLMGATEHKIITSSDIAGSNQKVSKFKIVKNDAGSLEEKLSEMVEGSASFLEVPQVPDPISCVCKLLDSGSSDNGESLLEIQAKSKDISAKARRAHPASVQLASHSYDCASESDAITCLESRR